MEWLLWNRLVPEHMKKVLVVDDDIDILTVVHLVLESHGLEVQSISKWQEIFSRIDTFTPDLILLDVSLGNQDGRNLCKQIKSNPSTKDIAIILFSANHDIMKTIPECLGNGFIAKPFDINDLIDNIDSQLASISG